MPHRRVQDILGYACLLNIVTFYSFYLPGMLLTEFAKSLPSSFLFSMTSFLVGFIVRPFGALCLGALADRKTRLEGLRVSALLIGFSSCLVCLVPDSSHWTYYVLRVVQGFALGGCYPILSVIIYEAAPSTHRGLYTGLFQTSVPAGYLFALAVTIVSKLLIGEENFLQNGWRTAFIYSALIFPAWWQLHKLLANVEYHDHPEISRWDFIRLKDWTVQEKKCAVYALLMATALGSIAIMGVNIKGFFLKSMLHLDPLTANHVIAYSTLFYTPTYALWGTLADRVGPRKVSKRGLIAGIILILPLFKLFEISAQGGNIVPFSVPWFSIFGVSVAISMIATACFGPFVMLVCNLVHHEHRCTLYGLSYNIATGVIGGTAYLISFYVFENTHTLYGGIIYILSLAALAGIAATLYRKRNAQHFEDLVK
ncbi:MFS transporter [Bdellovibrio sp. HCB274]|uniref:MFS transporter n=1 Tax=Bdellovibrio sp. HCB274 TaxID=3394361 RepID=UPI0039B4D51B